ncbi:response regulator transcription factor [uncultured Campylobacter sp.]|uniref:response regulator transcription factor n=1 Tax=uncultured Campylobacter sp. TaxID=218934 RepID=UPI002611E20D|nr:response regulator transcription factor [uncultured Campylobacter sp.]
MSNVLKQLSILVVEDEKDTRELMVEALEGVFDKVIVAQNGDEGTKKFKKFNPNLVVTDITMPIVDGLDMAKAIREISPQTPIIMLSAYSDKKKLLKAIDVGVTKYLLKPIDIEEFLKAIEDIAVEKINSADHIKIRDGLYFSEVKKVLIENGKEVPLTKKELAFVSLLTSRIGVIVSMDDIRQNIWFGEKVTDAAIRTFIKRVRDKIGQDTIVNISGLGYKMEKVDDNS